MAFSRLIVFFISMSMIAGTMGSTVLGRSSPTLNDLKSFPSNQAKLPDSDLPDDSPLSFEKSTYNSFQCVDPVTSCSSHGFCLFNSSGYGVSCKCDTCYVSHNCPSGVQCCYKQEPRVKLFLLSFFVAWTGAPYFVLGATGLGIGILLLCCGSCLVGTVSFTACGLDKKNGIGMAISIITYLAMLSALIWSLALWIMFAAETEDVLDKNGVAVCSW